MAKVWVIKEQMLRTDTGSVAMDYSPAMRYGELEFVTQFDLPTYGKGSTLKAWEEDVKRFVEKYDEMTDFIVATGQPASIFAVGAALGAARKVPRFLAWRRESSDYRPVYLDPDFLAAVTAV